MTVSMVMRCHDTETHPITFDEIWDATRKGSHGLKDKISRIRNRYEAEKDITGSPEKAKKAIGELKLELPGFLPSGTFAKRANEALVAHSGILCADLDTLGEKLPAIRDALKSYPFVRAIALSPSGDGLKVFFNVVNQPGLHEDSFRAIKQFMLDEAGLEIDEKCKDPARICFFTYDPDLWIRSEGNENIMPLVPLPKPRMLAPTSRANLTSREQIAFGLLGELIPAPEKGGYFVRCPGESFHTNRSAEKHTILYLESVPTLHCQHESCGSAVDAFNRVIRSEIGKAEFQESRISHPYRDMRNETRLAKNGQTPETELDPSNFVLFSPSSMKTYTAPEGIQLVGDCHILKEPGFVFVLGGPPGVGKSLGTIALAVAGSRGSGEWFGMQIHRKFKTMIIQTENGRYRLSRIFQELDCTELDDFVRISEPPPSGLLFQRSDFRKLVADKIAEFQPDVVVLDPWNSVALDQEQRTYLEAFTMLRSVLPPQDPPALGISAHTRKPQSDERSKGRALMHIIAGSHVLSSVPRSIFVMQPATDEPDDDQVVWTCCKNNDGELGKRTAWRRKIGLFEPVLNFDWDTFDSLSKDKRVVITTEMVEEVFKDGPLIRSLARDRLLELSGASKATIYKALSQTGRFADNLLFKEDTINWLRK